MPWRPISPSARSGLDSCARGAAGKTSKSAAIIPDTARSAACYLPIRAHRAAPSVSPRRRELVQQARLVSTRARKARRGRPVLALERVEEARKVACASPSPSSSSCRCAARWLKDAARAWRSDGVERHGRVSHRRRCGLCEREGRVWRGRRGGEGGARGRGGERRGRDRVAPAEWGRLRQVRRGLGILGRGCNFARDALEDLQGETTVSKRERTRTGVSAKRTCEKGSRDGGGAAAMSCAARVVRRFSSATRRALPEREQRSVKRAGREGPSGTHARILRPSSTTTSRAGVDVLVSKMARAL